MTDLVVKAKQVEYLIQSLPEPEVEQEQVRRTQTRNTRHANPLS